MARIGGKDRGIAQRKDRKGWWVRLYANGRQQWFKCDTKSQAKALYGRLRGEIEKGCTFLNGSLNQRLLHFELGSLGTRRASHQEAFATCIIMESFGQSCWEESC